MCGITGFFGFNDDDLLKSMCGTIVHRGPDDAGYYSGEGIGLAMRRLSIIDLKTGHQPISNETGDVWVVFNGEIYNYDELRVQLQQRGHVFRTTSDTETIVHLYEEHGLDFVQHLRGMFGIALWDDRNKSLVLARDRIGEKPLFYSYENGVLFFGSEMKTILCGRSERRVNPQAVCDFLATGYVAGAHTFFQGIEKLSPAHILVCSQEGIRVKRYWNHVGKEPRQVSFAQAEEELEHLLSETVRLCLKSDVEVGAFLSGGIDSSIIVALMKKHNAIVQTFSVGYSDEAAGFNETRYAKQVAQHLGTKHHELILGPQESIDLLPRILRHYDEPHGEPTSILVFLLCEFTRKRLKVALSGTGGDEVFFGYPKHAGIRMLDYYRKIPELIRKQLIERVISKFPESTKGSRFAKRAKRFIQGADLPPEEAYLSWTSLLHRETREALFSEQIKSHAEDYAGERYLRRYLFDPSIGSLLRRVCALDVGGYLPEYQLAYMDRMSMANSLEVRAPLCDFELIEYVMALPEEYRLKGMRSKHILKEIAKKYIPENIVERRKVGFDSPIGQWLKTSLKSFMLHFLSQENVRHSGLLNPVKVQELIQLHLSGKRDFSLQLWSILMLEAWYRMYIEDRVEPGDDYQLRHMRGAAH